MYIRGLIEKLQEILNEYGNMPVMVDVRHLNHEIMEGGKAVSLEGELDFVQHIDGHLYLVSDLTRE